MKLTAVACPDLAPIIQSGFPFDERVVETVRRYIAPLREADVDTVILGCTHYPLVAPMLQRMLGRGVQLVTSGDRAPRAASSTRSAPAACENPREAEGATASSAPATWTRSARSGTRFLQLPLGEVEHVVLTPRSR